MKLLVYLLAVQIVTVVCAYRRHGTPSRNSNAFLLRKVCVEVAGLKEEIADLKEENAAMKQPVDGQWVDWMQWSGCSVTCGPGTRTRQRLCLDPRPSNGGSDCAGSASETEDCEIIRCEDLSPPYSAFAIYGVTPTEDGSVLVFPNTKLNIAPDNGADFNTSSGKYCAEYYGIYSFHLHLYKTGPGNTAECAINKDDGARMETLAHAEVKSGTITGSTSTIVTLEQGDCVYVFDCNGTSLLSDQTSFNGALIDSLE